MPTLLQVHEDSILSSSDSSTPPLASHTSEQAEYPSTPPPPHTHTHSGLPLPICDEPASRTIQCCVMLCAPVASSSCGAHILPLSGAAAHVVGLYAASHSRQRSVASPLSVCLLPPVLPLCPAGVFSLYWAVAGRPELGGDLAARWTYLQDTFNSNRVSL